MSGPAPKRSDQRRRRNPTAGEEKLAGATNLPRKPVAAPEPEADWHPLAARWFESLAQSGQAPLYEASDWAQAAVMAEAISRELKPQPITVGSGDDAHVEMVSVPMKGATLAAWLKGCTDLLISEASRRRAAVELTVPQPETDNGGPAEVTDIRSWRESLNT